MNFDAFDPLITFYEFGILVQTFKQNRLGNKEAIAF